MCYLTYLLNEGRPVSVVHVSEIDRFVHADKHWMMRLREVGAECAGGSAGASAHLLHFARDRILGFRARSQCTELDPSRASDFGAGRPGAGVVALNVRPDERQV